MLKAIGLIELNSIAKGIEVTDFMMKAADVELLFSKPVCPGKFILLITGDVAAVNSSIDTGRNNGSSFVVDDLIIPNIHPQIIQGINGLSQIEEVNALGVLEFFSIASAITAADIAVKTALIQLIEIRLGVGVGGKSYITFTGDISAVNEAVEAGGKVAYDNGMLVHKVVIPSPRIELIHNLL
ncbi:Carboxysome shell and ethanolamine utilization microcompartment protein CcmL/EutN [Natronincola peptidivorans]|uniref:Carboxysome shell and ethanolamine utilization microcompartment protein CcmL/EutN n=1 Tax=Natronincola peptidivorans TaxID=426128 RepID=A0A1I0EVL2_9FIRM|nr:BMC domain-containing protein [Natronincola peptidivorans]SET49463.1 Carboxysome shell and ethanolamine utilization microcompartment protein CcmL/EutN [Natronincola peptidivorans]